ncbi:MAG: peptidoglycan editing factor PgeF [Tidjanibacter sp.]|nr:peptidoglycan editing factor PgeF [Tidjanibacter sp.]
MFEKNNMMYFDNLSTFNDLVHLQTTRKGGFSEQEFSSMNIGFSVGDNPDTVLRNRMEVARISGIALDRFVFPKQCHTANIAIVTEAECGRGVFPDKKDSIPETDALITSRKNVMLCIKTADCIPVLLYDPVRKVVAAIHAGWRGTAAQITQKTVLTMIQKFDCQTENIIAGIGAGAGLCCYETNEAFYNQIVASIGHNNYPDYAASRHHIDLKEINRMQLLNIGLQEQNIEINPICTICHCDEYFSHRGSGGHTGRALSCICMK